jgi:hypothetical protein
MSCVSVVIKDCPPSSAFLKWTVPVSVPKLEPFIVSTSNEPALIQSLEMFDTVGGYYHQSDPGIIIQSDPPKLSTRLIA